MFASFREKVIGLFLGTAIGDALGLPDETKTREQIALAGRATTYREIKPGEHKWHPQGFPMGTTSDDTQLTLAVARSFITSKGKFDMDEIAREHVVELDRDNHTWGPSTRNAVKRLKEGMRWSESGKTDKPNSGMGNGVVMKVSPLAAYLISPRFDRSVYPTMLFGFTGMTHLTELALLTCASHVACLRLCLIRCPDDRFVQDFVSDAEGNASGMNSYLKDKSAFELVEEMCQALRKSPTDEDIDARWGKDSFLVHNSLGLSYAYFLRNPASIEALYNTVNAGGDTDSNGALVGGLLGALNGPSVFPPHLVSGLQGCEEITAVAEQFCDSLEIY